MYMYISIILLLKRIFEIDCLNGKAMIEALEEIGKSKLTRYEVKYSEKEDRRQVLPKITQCTDLRPREFTLLFYTFFWTLIKLTTTIYSGS